MGLREASLISTIHHFPAAAGLVVENISHSCTRAVRLRRIALLWRRLARRGVRHAPVLGVQLHVVSLVFTLATRRVPMVATDQPMASDFYFSS